MVNSNVPRYSNLASELRRKYLFKFNCSNLFCLQFDQTRTWWLRCANRLQTCSVSTPAAIWWNCTASIRFDRWLQQCSGKIKHVPYFRANNWIFFQNVSYFVHFRAVFIDSFSFAMKHCNTSQGFGAFFVQSCDRFLFRLNFFSHFSRSFWFFF